MMCQDPLLEPCVLGDRWRVGVDRPRTFRHPALTVDGIGEMPPQESGSGEDDPTETGASARLFASLYADLRALAERQLRSNAQQWLSPTTLLHEAYIELSGKTSVFADRNHFMGYAARVMRGLLIDFLRERRALKRGGAFHITQLNTESAPAIGDDTDLNRLSEALDALAKTDPRLAEVVDLKYFCGFNFDEIAAQRGTSTRTVRRDWEKARTLLFLGLREQL
jgi:RNA polymerase sigma factor (TIGR02999 family)